MKKSLIRLQSELTILMSVVICQTAHLTETKNSMLCNDSCYLYLNANGKRSGVAHLTSVIRRARLGIADSTYGFL